MYVGMLVCGYVGEYLQGYVHTIWLLIQKHSGHSHKELRSNTYAAFGPNNQADASHNQCDLIDRNVTLLFQFLQTFSQLSYFRTRF
jgi:hypothetical protein